MRDLPPSSLTKTFIPVRFLGRRCSSEFLSTKDDGGTFSWSLWTRWGQDCSAESLFQLRLVLCLLVIFYSFFLLVFVERKQKSLITHFIIRILQFHSAVEQTLVSKVTVSYSVFFTERRQNTKISDAPRSKQNTAERK